MTSKPLVLITNEVLHLIRECGEETDERYVMEAIDSIIRHTHASDADKVTYTRLILDELWRALDAA